MSIFKAYDIRGIYGKDLTEKEAYMIGYYLAKHLNIDRIKISHDRRLSYETLTKFLIQGLIDADCEIVYQGSCSTPNFYFSLFDGCKNGIMITASHNPKEYNGFKIINEGKSFDSRNGMYELEKLVKEDSHGKCQDFELIFDSLNALSFKEFCLDKEISRREVIREYIAFLNNLYSFILKENEKDILKETKFTIDFSSGMSSIAVLPVLEDALLNFKSLNDLPDGDFPEHSPDPLKVSGYLKKNVDKDSHFALAFDGDGDRIVFYDEKGNDIVRDFIIARFIEHFSKSSKSFVVDLRVSKIISEMAIEKKLDLKLEKVGRAYYMDFMAKHSCAFGAELSGHMFFRDFHNLDNPDVALIYMFKFVAQNLLKNPKAKFTDMFKPYEKYTKINETNVNVKNPEGILEILKSEYEKEIVSELDGVSLDFGNYWYNVRKSNTEDVVRVNFEAKTAKTANKEFKKLIKFLEEN